MNPKFLMMLMFFPIILISVALHEFAHCWTTDRLGDDTPRYAGRVTLNPLAHLDPLGTLMMVISAFAGFGIGWGRPSPMNPNNFRHPARDRMISAFAGPFSNMLMLLAWASLGAILGHIDINDLSQGMAHAVVIAQVICSIGVLVNTMLAAFNLLPVFPLDGHHILSYFVPHSWRPIIDDPRWMYVFLAIVLIPQLNRAILSPVLDMAIRVSTAICATLTGWTPLLG